MNVYFEKSGYTNGCTIECTIKQSHDVANITPERLYELRESVNKAEKEMGNLKQLTEKLSKLRDFIY